MACTPISFCGFLLHHLVHVLALDLLLVPLLVSLRAPLLIYGFPKAWSEEWW
jgi:hypothetical protein